MGLNDKPILCGDFLLESFDFAILKLHNGAATGADQMIVMTFVRDVVVLCLGTEVSSLGNAGFAKQVQCAVDGGEADLLAIGDQAAIHVLRAEVALRPGGSWEFERLSVPRGPGRLPTS